LLLRGGLSLRQSVLQRPLPGRARLPLGVLRRVSILGQLLDPRLDQRLVCLGHGQLGRRLSLVGLGGAEDPVGHLSGAADDDTAGFAAVRRDLPAVDQARANLHALFVVDRLAGGEHVAVLGEVAVDVEDDIALLATLGTAAILPVEPQVLVELVKPEVEVDLSAEVRERVCAVAYVGSTALTAGAMKPRTLLKTCVWLRP